MQRASWRSRTPKEAGGYHFLLPARERRVCYVYIRKNGCSSFKQWMLTSAPDERKGESDIDTMTSLYGLTSKRDLYAVEKLLVVRWPHERICSLFRNKFIQRAGNDGATRSVANLAGLDPDDMTFRNLVEAYISRFVRQSDVDIDPHFLPQYAHLFPLHYDFVIELRNLQTGIQRIFGNQVANAFFSKPVNASSTVIHDESTPEVSSLSLREKFLCTGALPSDASLLGNDLLSSIRSAYEADYLLMEACFPR